jgi:hypothetical protein
LKRAKKTLRIVGISVENLTVRLLNAIQKQYGGTLLLGLGRKNDRHIVVEVSIFHNQWLGES